MPATATLGVPGARERSEGGSVTRCRMSERFWSYRASVPLPLGRQDLKTAWRSSIVRWLLLAVAVVVTVGWMLELRPLATVWGPVGSWVGGIAAALGLIFTGGCSVEPRRRTVRQ